MSAQVVSILVLCLIFLIATLLPVHMGALALAATFIVGVFVLDGSLDDKYDQLTGGFPGDLFVTLAGVTFLFAIAKNNGTVDWLVHIAVQCVRGRVVFIPWIMFLVTAILTAVGSVVPAAVAIIAPIGMGFARRYRINQVLMGLMVVNGATAGGFSPISIFGSITNGVVQRSHLDGSPVFLFLASFVFNTILGIITFVLFGGRELIGVRDRGDGTLETTGAAGGVADADLPGGTPSGGSAPGRFRLGPAEQTGTTSATLTKARPDTVEETEAVTSLDVHRTLTVVGLVALAIGALFFDLDVGFLAFVVASVLSLGDPKGTKGAVNQIAWPTVLLVCGIVTYVSLMETIGTIDFLGDEVAGVGSAMVAAVLICYIGGVVSAFASTTGILGALIPLAVPFLHSGSGVGAVGLVTALAISASVVDSSPFSTSGSLVVANAPEEDRDRVFRRLIQWGFSMVAVAPLAAWAVLVAPGWL